MFAKASIPEPWNSFSMASSQPVESSSSASSMTVNLFIMVSNAITLRACLTYLRRRNDSRLTFCMKSMRRPGVATRMSQPISSCSRWFLVGAPP